jgi:hypothetical protein
LSRVPGGIRVDMMSERISSYTSSERIDPRLLLT